MLVTDPAQRVQDVEVGDAQVERLEDGADGAFVIARAQQQAPGHFERAGIQMRVTFSPRLHDAVDEVTIHREKFSLTSSELVL